MVALSGAGTPCDGELAGAAGTVRPVVPLGLPVAVGLAAAVRLSTAGRRECACTGAVAWIPERSACRISPAIWSALAPTTTCNAVG